ncbi:hypothetical protein PsYK624_153430 [Phanerochaete sordida]|uniref:Uncharacterized protein n=1 Tax=Phanerochaete sordida TaxID=48140 RepID=A0A9P3GPD2_9APHY|nr:hypothetical protein PsYK624_153430 [Phanerochaete sordida]
MWQEGARAGRGLEGSHLPHGCAPSRGAHADGRCCSAQGVDCHGRPEPGLEAKSRRRIEWGPDVLIDVVADSAAMSTSLVRQMCMAALRDKMSARIEDGRGKQYQGPASHTSNTRSHFPPTAPFSPTLIHPKRSRLRLHRVTGRCSTFNARVPFAVMHIGGGGGYHLSNVEFSSSRPRPFENPHQRGGVETGGEALRGAARRGLAPHGGSEYAEKVWILFAYDGE